MTNADPDAPETAQPAAPGDSSDPAEEPAAPADSSVPRTESADPSPTESEPTRVGAPPLVAERATTPEPVEMHSAPARSASDAYVFAALLCAVVGLVVPLLPAAAALMLLRATDEDLTGEPLRPQLTGVASFARGLAWFDLIWMTLVVAALLLGVLGRVLTS